MDVVLVAGLWLEKSVWDPVADALRTDGLRATAVALPGVDEGTASATLADQVGAVLAAVDASKRAVVVGHSAACTLAWMAADRRPDAVECVVLIGGFPAAPGEKYADFFPLEDGQMFFPGWEPFAGPDSDDLDESIRSRIANTAVPVPEGVATGTVSYLSDERFRMPVVMICPEFSPDQAKRWIDEGHIPELERVGDLTLIDIDSGHWPMFSRPGELARLIAGVARDLQA